MSAGTTLWDLPTRLFHWLLVVLIPLAWWTAEEGHMQWHAWIGYALLVLVTFRLVWGFAGSRHARFSDFLRGPRGVREYLTGGAAGSVGHNPLGGWSVVALLAVLLLQAVSGLFNSDDVLFDGPLHYWADTPLRDTMGSIHDLAFNLLLGLIALHLAAVLYYQFVRRQPLVGAMLRGRAEGRDGLEPPVSPLRALLIVGVAALALWGIITVAPEPQLPW